MKAPPLRRRQKIFAEKLAEGRTATEAYLLAGYHSTKRETAHRAASRLYGNPGVRTYIQELRRAGDDLAREETTLTIAQKLAFLARLVLTSSAALREDDPLIQSHRILKDGSTSIRMPCKLKALKMHSDLAGHHNPPPAPPIAPRDLLQELLDQIRRAPAPSKPEPPRARPVSPPLSLEPGPSPEPLPAQERHTNSRNPPAPTPSNPSDQKTKPPPTTTKRSEQTPPKQAPPPTPADLRRLVQAQIRQASPLYHTTLGPPALGVTPKASPTILRS